METSSYTYSINIVDKSSLQAFKRNPKGNPLGTTFGSLSYEKYWHNIERLHQIAIQNALRPEEIKELGENLFYLLFDDKLYNDFYGFYREVVFHERGLLHVKLLINSSLFELASLPWEFICVPHKQMEPSIWLSTNPQLIFSRNAPFSDHLEPLRLREGEKLTVLLAVAAPETLQAVEYKSINRIVRQMAIDDKNKRFNEPVLVKSANLENMIDALKKYRPHIFHFIGHGRLMNEKQQEVEEIALSHDISIKREDWTEAELFAEMLAHHTPQVVFIQACESAALSSTIASTGIVARIIERRVPVVIAMQYEITNSTAQRFAKKFYQCLSQNEPVEKAVQEGRNYIMQKPALGYKKRDFATPVLFIQVENGCFFVNNHEVTEASLSASVSSKTYERTHLTVLTIPEQNSTSKTLTELYHLFRDVFNAKQEVWQSDCSKVTDNLKSLSRMTQYLVNQAHEEGGLMNVGERMILENIDEHTSSLISSINRFHDTCPPSYQYEVGHRSERYMKQYNKDHGSIREAFQALIEHIDRLKEHERAFLLLFPKGESKG